MFVRRVFEDENGPFTRHLVRKLVHGHDLIQGLFECDPVQRDGVVTILILTVVGHADAGQARDGAEDLAKRRVVETEPRQQRVEVV